MDGLALLCNLYADGPVTLARLRLAGVADLAELERAAPARLAEWLHASLPQAQAFAAEAHKLVRRLAEGSAAPALAPAVRAAGPTTESGQIVALSAHAPSPGAEPLRAGLIPGLDDALCARLALHNVRTVQALSEFSGLALARRTGIPYSTLLELSRHARRFGLARAPESRPPESGGVKIRSVELVPFTPPAKRAPAEREFARSDEFTLPMAESESAGPFG